MVLAVCAGFQLIGTTLVDGSNRAVDGLGLIDAVTTRAPQRLVGEVAVHDEALGTGWLVGFENHRGVTAVGAGVVPLGPRQPERGCPTDGAVRGRVVGTYLHGPVLARNPRLADQLLEWVTGPLEPFADPQADLLHEERCAEIIGGRARSRWARPRRRRRPRQPQP